MRDMVMTSQIRNLVESPYVKRWIEKIKSKTYWGGKIYRLCLYILLFDLAFVFLFPFMYMIITSFKSPRDLIDISVYWIPRELYFQNYRLAYGALEYFSYFKNSVIVTALTTLGHIVCCSFVAYGLARFKFPGRDIIFILVILTIIIPIQTIIVPLYIRYSSWKWTGSYLPIIVPTFFGFGLKGGLFVFIFRQFFLTLPYELEDAALIDGCGVFKTFFKIVLPISRSAMLVSAVLSMVWHWNDYFEPSIYLNRPKTWILAQLLPSMYNMLNQVEDELLGGMDVETVFNEAVVMAGTTLVILPILIVYIVLQRGFQQGIERTGLVE